MKTKSRNLLTVILAALCAAAVALGIGLLLPKVQKINANASANAPIMTVGAVTTQTGPATVSTTTTAISYGDTTVNPNLSSVVQQFSIKINIPAYTAYEVVYSFTDGTGIGGFGGSPAFVTMNTITTYYPNGYGSGGGIVLHNLSFNDNVRGALTSGSFSVNNLVYVNNSSTPQDYYAYFDVEFVVTQKQVSAMVGSTLTFNSNTVNVTNLPVPSTTDTTTFDYSGSAYTVNFKYTDTVNLTDRNGQSHSYTTGYNSVTVTADAVNSSGVPVGKSAYTLTTNDSSGTGSITATNAGVYTVRFNLKANAISDGVEWVGGGTGEKTIVLTINKINPTVTPDVGTGPFYTSNGLYNDVTINTTAGDTPGTIAWDSGQTLTAGTNNYGWTFTPTDTRNYNTKTGTESVTVAGIAITGISATFNQGSTTYYTSGSLNDMKARLAVDKEYNDNTTARLADADYTLSVDGGGALVAGTNTIKVTYTSSSSETPAITDFDDTFTVEITAVEITAIAASFNPNGNDIYLSNSLSDLDQYLTVTGTYNDGSTKTLTTSDYSITDPAALSLGNVTVTVTSTEDNTVTGTFTVNVIPDIVPVALPLPEAKDYTYSGEELDAVGALTTLTEEEVIKYLDVTGTASARRAGEYTVKFKIKDEFLAAGNVSWNTSNLSSLPDVQVSADGNSVELKWNILKAKVAATWDEEECIWVPVISGTLAETTEPNFLTQTYTNSDGKAFTNRDKLAGGRTYQVTARISPQYADNFEFDGATQSLIDSGSETYTYTPEYKPSVWEKIVAFLKKNWLWLVIAAAAIILLIIIIVVAKKCHKTKEQKEEIRARKEEERQRKLEEKERREEERRLQQERLEEERRLQREKLEAEREMAKAKQEAELEKIRAQAGMAAGAGMATMAVQQPQQQVPVQQVQTVDNELLKEMNRQMAELRADNKQTQAQLQALQNNQNSAPMQYSQYPQYQQPMMPQMPMMQMPMQMPQYGGDPTLARLEAQLNAMQSEQRARYDAEQRIELAAMRAEQHVDRDSRHSVDLAAMREHINGYSGNRVPDYSAPAQPAYNQPNSVDMLGALVAATLKNMANGTAPAAQSQPVPELPQKAEQGTPVTAKYPSDAVITTTTTVDTTKNKPIRREEDTNFDVDGFYDTFE